MTFDGLILKRLVSELEIVQGQQLKQVYQLGKTEFFMKFSRAGISISLGSTTPFISLEEKATHSTSIETPFGLFMRRHLNGLVLTKVSQEKLDRIVYFTFEGSDAFGEREKNTLVVELMGPGSNLIVLESDRKIAQAFREMVTSKRTVARTLEYYPPEPPGEDLTSITIEETYAILERSTLTLSKAIRTSFAGISRASAENITAYLQLEEVTPSQLGEEKLLELVKFLHTLSREKDKNLYLLQSGETVEVSAIPLDFKGDCIEKPASKALSYVLRVLQVEREIDRRKGALTRKLDKLINRQDRLVRKLEGELASLDDYEKYRRYGELLVSNLYRLSERTAAVELEDWESGEKVSLSLDERLTPSQNAQLFFKYFNKSQRKEVQVKKRLKLLAREIEYLEQLKEMVELCDTLSDLEQLRDELTEVGLLRKASTTRKKPKRTVLSGPRTFEKYGFKYLVGKSNVQNDEVTKNASRGDVWFHARGIPGAHVILKKAGMEITDAALGYGALLAGRYSKGRQSGKVDVDYTLVDNVSKPKGAKPGMVIYKNFKTMTVDLERERVEDS